MTLAKDEMSVPSPPTTSIRLNKVNNTLKSIYSILGVETNEEITASTNAKTKTASFFNIFNILVVLCLRDMVLNILYHSLRG
ncbi:hypothetical protein [Clostridium sp.]|uniref:hypothetical protein n=1 Tax=Clostridium sp. TaxID=1506 RepID=UPI003D6CF8DD